MAITKIAGEILESNLIRVQDLSFSGGNPALQHLLHVDVTNGRIGIKTDSPGNFALDVNGNTRTQGSHTITGDLVVEGTTTTIDSQNLVVEDNIITLNENASSATDAGLMINRTGENNAVFYWDEVRNKFRVGTTTSDGSTRTDLSSVNLARLQVATPTADDDAAHKKYIDDSVAALSSSGSSINGMTQELSTPTDSTFGDGSFTGLTPTTKVTDAIDSLNETMENIRNNTYVKSVTFTSSSVSISSGDTITLSITAVGNANRYDITWGDGNSDTVSTTSPTHTYTNTGLQSITAVSYTHLTLPTILLV